MSDKKEGAGGALGGVLLLFVILRVVGHLFPFSSAMEQYTDAVCGRIVPSIWNGGPVIVAQGLRELEDYKVRWRLRGYHRAVIEALRARAKKNLFEFTQATVDVEWKMRSLPRYIQEHLQAGGCPMGPVPDGEGAAPVGRPPLEFGGYVGLYHAAGYTDAP